MGRVPVPTEVRLEVEEFLAREAELLDERLLTDWLALFTDDARYTLRLREPPRRPEEGAARSCAAAREDGPPALGGGIPAPPMLGGEPAVPAARASSWARRAVRARPPKPRPARKRRSRREVTTGT